jgi:hypothetical protein
MNLDEILKNRNDACSFTPDEGVFRTRLTGMLLAEENEEFVDLFSEQSSDFRVTVSGSTAAEGVIRCQVSGDFGERSLTCRLAALSQPELSDLTHQLAQLSAKGTAPAAQPAVRVIMANKIAGDMLRIDEAAQKLGLSRQALKSNIPCSDYSYVMVNEKVEIKEYFWSESLIEGFCTIKKSGATAEDIKAVADECCHGDLDWSREVIGVVSPQSVAPQRGNQAQKETPKQPAGSAPSKKSHHRHRR